MDTEKELQGQACEGGKADEQTCKSARSRDKGTSDRGSSNRESSNVPERDSTMEPQPYGLPGKEPPPDETPPVSAFA